MVRSRAKCGVSNQLGRPSRLGNFNARFQGKPAPIRDDLRIPQSVASFARDRQWTGIFVPDAKYCLRHENCDGIKTLRMSSAPHAPSDSPDERKKSIYKRYVVTHPSRYLIALQITPTQNRFHY